MGKMTTTEKITLLREIQKYYSLYKKQWPLEKVDMLQKEVIQEVQNIGTLL